MIYYIKILWYTLINNFKEVIMDLELIKKLEHFHLYSNLGFTFSGVDKYEKYNIFHHNQIKDIYFNFITDINANDKEEFDQIIQEASSKIKAKNREVIVYTSPTKKTFLDDTYELLSSEVWQIYKNFDQLNLLQTNCPFNVTLEQTTNMKLYSKELIKAYQTGDSQDPYGDLDTAYQEVYANYTKTQNNFACEFFFAKVNGEIVGITQGVYDHEIYGIYGLAVKKQFRNHGIGKEIVKQQLQMCKNKNLQLAFLQTEDGYYPADIYRKLGFEDVCMKYYYKKN